MPIYYVNQSIFDIDAKAIVNPVNCLGVMGSGLAKQFADRYPDMLVEYQDICRSGWLRPGRLHVFPDSTPIIINFPTKTDWRKPSRLSYIIDGLVAFRELPMIWGFNSVAFPQLGCGKGDLDWKDVRPVMERFLKPLPITVYISLFS